MSISMNGLISAKNNPVDTCLCQSDQNFGYTHTNTWKFEIVDTGGYTYVYEIGRCEKYWTFVDKPFFKFYTTEALLDYIYYLSRDFCNGDNFLYRFYVDEDLMFWGNKTYMELPKKPEFIFGIPILQQWYIYGRKFMQY